jgi:hypothetical protein
MTYQRHDKPLGHHWLPGRPGNRQPAADSLTSDPSQARLIAEAAFVQRPSVSAANAGPNVVVIKRKKAIAVPGVGDAVIAGSDGLVEETRTPRVFRVETPILGSMQDVDVSASDVGASPAPPVHLKPKRRRTPRPVVTIIHPPDPPAPLAIDRQAPAEADVLVEKLRHLEPSLASLHAAQSLDVDLSRLGRRASTRHHALRARIERLNKLAEVARKTEAARAVHWIKRAIITYGLEKEDLGL